MRFGLRFFSVSFVLLAVALGMSSTQGYMLSLPDRDFGNAKISSLYAGIDRDIDARIVAAIRALSTRDQAYVEQRLKNIESVFVRLDIAYRTGDKDAFAATVTQFRKEYALLKTLLARRTASLAASGTTGGVAAPARREIQSIPLGRDLYSSLGIKLDAGIPTQYLVGETLRITGAVTDKTKQGSIVLLVMPDKKTRSIMSLPVTEGRIDYSVPLEKPGIYGLVVAAGSSFETTEVGFIAVADPTTDSLSELDPAPADLPAISSLGVKRVNFSDLRGVNIVSFDGRADPKVLYTLELTSSGATRLYRGMGSVAVPADALDDWASGASVGVRVFAQRSLSTASVDVYTAPKIVYEDTLTLADSYVPKAEIAMDVSASGSRVLVSGTVPKNVTLERDIYLVAPSGHVERHTLPDAIAADKELLKPGAVIDASIPVAEKGVYLVELNYDTGFAAVNVPIRVGTKFLPLGANVIDTMRDEDYDTVKDVTDASLRFVNGLRSKDGAGKVAVSDTLSRLAQTKANDMAQNAYVGHVDSQGTYIDGMARRAGIVVRHGIAENVAGGNVTYGVLNAALSLSGGHRANMLSPEWTKVGIGIARQDGNVYYVQVFGTE